MKRSSFIVTEVVSYFFILLFLYASVSKILDFENFQVQLAQSPILSAYAGIVSYGVVILELLIVACLCFPTWRLIGLHASTALMSAFTVYIYLILNYSDFIPCSCGGILEKLGWKEHLVFNILCVVFGMTAVLCSQFGDKLPTRRAFLVVSGSSVLCVGSVVMLFLSSEHIIKTENNFTRRFLPNFLLEPKVIPLNGSEHYFAGIDKDQLFLGNRRTPLVFSSIDLSNQNLSQNRIYPDLGRHHFKNLRFAVKDSYYYLYDGTVPIIYRGKIGQSAPKTVSFNEGFFSQLAVLDSATFALRTQSSTTHSFTLARLDLNRSERLRMHPEALNKQLDGIFDLDGQMVENRETPAKAVYAYAYRNRFIIADPGFMKFRQQKTIDSHETASLQITQLSNGRHTMKAPPVKVNSGVAAFKQWVFIISEIRGQYEPASIHRDRKTIDVYNTALDQYAGSFYVPEKKINDLLVTGDHLLLLTDTAIIQYRFRKPFD